jgi:hypothetical protein
MTPLRYFLDTHDASKGTFPPGLTPEQFSGFYPGYEAACFEEGVVPVRIHVGYDDGRAFCLTMAADADAVRRAHQRAGLPFDSITEVLLASSGDTFLPRAAA